MPRDGRPRRTITPTERAALRKILNALGGIAGTADVLGISLQAVAKWRLHGIPAHHVPVLSRLTGMSRASIRPDLYR
jgi:hypothetical protein